MRIGRVLSSEITENRDGEGKVLLLQVELSDPDDVQTVEYAQAAGEDFRPPEDTTVIVTDLGEAWKIAIAADDGIDPESLDGEKEIYAISGGEKKGRLKCNLDGTVQAGINNLDFVAQAAKVHTEISNMLQAGVAAGGPGAANFTAAKTAWDLIFVYPLTGVASANLQSED